MLAGSDSVWYNFSNLKKKIDKKNSWLIFKPDGLKKMPLLLFTPETSLPLQEGAKNVKEL